MKVALFFGSFNPIHVGHLIIAERVLDASGCQALWLVVSPQNPFKKKQTLAPAVDRYYMCELAVDNNPRLRANNIEFALPKPSFTVDTLTVLTDRYPTHQFCLVMGGDNLAHLHKWKNYEAILKYYPIFVYPRPGQGDLPDYPNVTVTPAPFLDISASYVRQLVQEKKSLKYLLPDPVIDYINRKNLYGA